MQLELIVSETNWYIPRNTETLMLHEYYLKHK